MNKIHIIKGLKLNNKGLLVKGGDNKWSQFHKRQGTLDGACAVYSLMMNLHYLGIICDADMELYKKADGRTKKGKFLNHLLEDQGLVRSGYHYIQLVKEINTFLNNDVVAERIWDKDADKIIQQIDFCLSDEIPVIISIESPEMSHALLAIGEEINERNIISKIFCIDPSEDISPLSYWNCLIDVSSNGKSEYPFWYITEKDKDKQKIKLGDIIKINKINKLT